jgi:hypothetical protein
MRKTLLLILIATPIYVKSQVAETIIDSARHWKLGLEGGIALNQAYFSDSWKGGGINSIAISGYLYGLASYEKGRWTWNNNLKLLYGLQKNKSQDWRKNLDMIDYTTKAKIRIHKHWHAFGSGNLISQFTNGYEYTGVFDPDGREISNKISGLFSPAYIQESFGIEYKPADWFYMNVGALALRQTVVMDTSLYNYVPSNYGVEIGKRLRNQLGVSFELSVDKTIAKNLNIKYKYRAFTDFNAKNFDDIVHRMDLVITATVVKYLKVSLTGIMLYDNRMDSRVQWNQGLALGVGYRIANFKDKK